MKDYTKILEQKGAERTRLTRQLQAMLSKVAKEIAAAVPNRTEVTVDAVSYRTHCYRSNIGSFQTVVVVDPESPREDFDGGMDNVPLWYRAIDDYTSPGGEFYLHQDFHCTVSVAKSDEFLHFANNLPEIVRAFEAKEDLVIAGLRGAFEKLRALAE